MSIRNSLLRLANEIEAPLGPWIAGLAIGHRPWRVRALQVETIEDLVVHCRRLGRGGEIVLPAETASQILGQAEMQRVAKFRAALGEDADRFRVLVSGSDGELTISDMGIH